VSVAMASIIRPGQAMPPGVRITGTFLEFDATISEDAWEGMLRLVAQYGSASQWWIGDALVHGEIFHREGEKEYQRAIAVTGFAEATLKQFKHVASRFPKERRRASLPWSHHLEVASLSREAQETWLIRAEAERMTRQELRDALAGLAGQTVNGHGDGLALVPFSLKTDEERVERWRHAALVAGLTDAKGQPDLRTWAMRVLDEAAA
jgi:hypothetical protein